MYDRGVFQPQGKVAVNRFCLLMKPTQVCRVVGEREGEREVVRE